MHGFVKPNENNDGGTLNDRKGSGEEISARSLLTSLRKINKVFRKIDFGAWTSAFRVLMKQHQEEEIKEVLEFFCRNPKNSACCQVNSAYTFCERYESIKVKMEVHPLATSKLDPLVLPILKELVDFRVPAGLDTHLPTITHRNLSRVQDFLILANKHRSKLLELGGDDKKKANSKLLFLSHLDSISLLTKRKLTLLWTQDFLKMMAKWETWGGAFGTLLFDPYSQRFQSIGRKVCVEWSGSSKQWDSLMQEVLP